MCVSGDRVAGSLIMVYYIMGRYMEVWGGVLGSRQGTGNRLRVSRGWLSSQEDKTEKDVVGEIGPETGGYGDEGACGAG